MRLPRLRRYLAWVAFSGVAAAVLVVAQASELAQVIAAGVAGRFDRAALLFALLAAGLRGVLHLVSGTVATRTAAAVKADLRAAVLAEATGKGPEWLAGQRAGELATLVGRGVDALDPYLTGYLPQLVLSVTVPVAVLLRLAWADLPSAIVVGVTLPLLPVFAALVGWHTQARTERQWRLLSQLGGHFLDMLAGMTTLRAFGRARAQVEVVRVMADRYRSATMGTLRVAFLSALVLELIATVSVALVAVPVGLRLLSGALTLPVALVVLLLAPEAYAPLRAAGAQFHASQEGLSAAADVFAVLESPASSGPRASAAARLPDPGSVELVFERVSARCLREVSFTVRPGERVALTGPSGEGKSTLLALVLGFLAPEAGRVLAGGVDLSTVDLAAWRARLAWVPQRPHLFAASVADNIRLGAPAAADEAVHRAARAAHADEFVRTLPSGYGTVLGEHGYGLSGGQRQRLALARAFLRIGAAPDALVLLDEPTARLDAQSEAAVLAGSAELVTGRTALLVAHRPALLTAATRTLNVASGTVTPVPVFMEVAGAEGGGVA
ncbi:MAG TPA: thiol reductant ABC exporter subunit CydD [Rugosimonospora sp.]|nr:thiol reductant ABC exporter subunit CydD [Rugosimonospora sp.]